MAKVKLKAFWFQMDITEHSGDGTDMVMCEKVINDWLTKNNIKKEQFLSQTMTMTEDRKGRGGIICANHIYYTD